MCEVKKYGLIHDSFLVEITKTINLVPDDFNAGFFLHFKLYNDKIIKFWFPDLLRVVVSGTQLFLYERKFDDKVLCFDNTDIKAFQIEYDELLAEYNGECVDEETKKLFNLSVWEENKIATEYS